MKQTCKRGDIKSYQKKVLKRDAAAFDSGEVHPVYATFAVARDAEWAGRLFVLDMKDDDEEGIGFFVTVIHHSPALIGEEVQFKSEIIKIDGNEVICTYEAKIGERLIADGVVGQKILKKTKIEKIFNDLKEH